MSPFFSLSRPFFIILSELFWYYYFICVVLLLPFRFVLAHFQYVMPVPFDNSTSREPFVPAPPCPKPRTIRTTNVLERNYGHVTIPTLEQAYKIRMRIRSWNLVTLVSSLFFSPKSFRSGPRGPRRQCPRPKNTRKTTKPQNKIAVVPERNQALVNIRTFIQAC